MVDKSSMVYIDERRRTCVHNFKDPLSLNVAMSGFLRTSSHVQTSMVVTYDTYGGFTGLLVHFSELWKPKLISQASGTKIQLLSF